MQSRGSLWNQCCVSATVPTTPPSRLVRVPETSLVEHLSSVWSYHASILGGPAHHAASTAADKTWHRCQAGLVWIQHSWARISLESSSLV